jgi:hypothetical protein
MERHIVTDARGVPLARLLDAVHEAFLTLGCALLAFDHLTMLC